MNNNDEAKSIREPSGASHHTPNDHALEAGNSKDHRHKIEPVLVPESNDTTQTKPLVGGTREAKGPHEARASREAKGAKENKDGRESTNEPHNEASDEHGPPGEKVDDKADFPKLQKELAQKMDAIIISQHNRENICQDHLVKKLGEIYQQKQSEVQAKIDSESKDFHNKLHEGIKDAFVDFITRATKHYQEIIAQYWTYDLARAQNDFIKEYRLILEEKDARIDELKRRLRVIARKEGLAESGIDLDELRSTAPSLKSDESIRLPHSGLDKQSEKDLGEQDLRIKRRSKGRSVSPKTSSKTGLRSHASKLATRMGQSKTGQSSRSMKKGSNSGGKRRNQGKS